MLVIVREMATHSSVLAWRIPGMGEPGGLPSMRSHRVGHDWGDLVAVATAVIIIVKHLLSGFYTSNTLVNALYILFSLILPAKL